MSTAFQGEKPALRLSQIINMSVGFFGIQFGWDLQRANMGRIYENLGANPDEVPLLFLAAPLTGLLVQPVVGYMGPQKTFFYDRGPLKFHCPHFYATQ